MKSRIERVLKRNKENSSNFTRSNFMMHARRSEFVYKNLMISISKGYPSLIDKERGFSQSNTMQRTGPT